MRLHVAILSAAMLLSGSLNTIATKLQDEVVVGRDDEGNAVLFKHPVVQTTFMFAGESLCLLPFLISRLLRRRGGAAEHGDMRAQDKAGHTLRTMAAFALPALCDAGATTLLNLGLYYTYASVFQMLRGTLVIFAAGLTLTLLKRRLHSHNYLGIVLIAVGAALVGASSLLYERGDEAAAGEHASSAPNPLLGDVLVIAAQFLNALQFIVEEKFLLQYRAPVLLAVGTEGAVGLALSAAALPLLARLRTADGAPLDDAAAAVRQIAGDPTLRWTTGATVLSIALFNFCGVSVTKNLSGAARAAIDACRTAIIWAFCVRMGWERFHTLQVVGFAVLISGTSVYNDILRSCLPWSEEPPAGAGRERRHRRAGGAADGAAQPLLEDDSDDSGGGGVAYMQANDATRARVLERAHGPPQPSSAGAARSGAIAAGPPPTAPLSMARTMTMLPQALSPHSLASGPRYVPQGGSGISYWDYQVLDKVPTPRRDGSSSSFSSAPSGELPEAEAVAPRR